MKTSPLVILALTGSINARLSKGKCSNVKVPAYQNVEVERLEGDWYPIYADNESEKAGFDLSCIKAKAVMAQNWWEEYEEQSWDQVSSVGKDDSTSEASSSDDSDEQEAGAEGENKDEKKAGAEGENKDEKKAGAEGENKDEKKAGAEGENKDEKKAGAEDKKKAGAKDEKKAGAEGENKDEKKAGAEAENKDEKKAGAEDKKQDKKKAAKKGKDRKVGKKPAEGTARLLNSATQIKDGDQVFGMNWTVDIQTKGDATGVGYFLGKEMCHGQLVDIDYDSYVIAYSCEQVSDDMKHEGWGINVRDPNLNADEKKAIWNKANEQLKKANQSNEAFLKEEKNAEKEDDENREFYSFEKDLAEVKQGDEAKCDYLEW